jgi:5-methylcytosine-specific restriction endonuclease McrA
MIFRNAMRILVLDSQRKPLMPCHPARARRLLTNGKAAVFRRFPMTIILKGRVGGEVQPVTVKLDPGSKTTGIALVGEFDRGSTVLAGIELNHRGQLIQNDLADRRAYRRGRRQRNTRYRAPRFDNRRRPAGWLAPSLQHRVETTLTWVNRLLKFAPITGMAQELVRFDTQLMQNPEIAGVEYQQGELAGYEAREYLLEKWGRKCAYCATENVLLEVEHIVARSNGGSDRVSNLTLACRCCNQKKGSQPVEQFLKRKPELLKRILATAKAPLKDAAAVNSTRWALFDRLKAIGLPVATGTGGQTKYNRSCLGIAKSHWADAACVGNVEMLHVPTMKPLTVTCVGHGTRLNQKRDRFGFPRGAARARTDYQGFKTGAYVELNQPNGKYAGHWQGNLAGIRADGRLDIRVTIQGKPSKITANAKHYRLLQQPDGYRYA